MKRFTYFILFALLLKSSFGRPINTNLPLIAPKDLLPRALTDIEIQKLTTSVDKALKALAPTQLVDGSFPNPEYSKAAVTSMAIMAFLSRGYKPGEGEYGELIDKGVNYILSIQQKSGLFAHKELNYKLINIRINAPKFEYLYDHEGVAKSYCHPISMLMLGEVYGLSDPEQSFRIREAIDRGLECTLAFWNVRKKPELGEGGFRYFRPYQDYGADMSVTSWFAASFRSLGNAGFDVPKSAMDRIAAYVVRNQQPDGGYRYTPKYDSSTMIMTAAGTLCVALAGKHDDPSVMKSSLYLSKFNVNSKLSFTNQSKRYYPYYTCYYMTQVSVQLGGALWEKCMKDCYDFLMSMQMESGFWPPQGHTARFGNVYSTSMAILALTPSLKLLPIYQR